ncbi:translational machinery component [Pluteus cervinus]|uniref:Translational machinery component n=1 Tax=Pluteus cervinus TaxID=181527 RepID=A0ACD3BGJ8_9AGAR|nr:translational machinery component [Pluteus cervinus]
MFALRVAASPRASLAGVSRVGRTLSSGSLRLAAARSLTTTTTSGDTEVSPPTTDFLEPTSPAESLIDDSEPPLAGPDGFPPPKSTIPNPFKDTFSRSSTSPLSSSAFDKIIKPATIYRLHCHSTRNNTITTLTTRDGKPIAWFSGGSCGFKKGNRSSYEAGYQCAVRMFQKIKEVQSVGTGPIKVELFFKGFGQGRDALHKALSTSEGNEVRPVVSMITDRTAIKIGGTRAKKTRRL